jgi:hypothetical protein
MSIKLWHLSWRWHRLVHVCRRWRCVFCVAKLSRPLVMPWSSPEPKFKPEPLRTGPRSSPKFSHGPEPDQKSSSQFKYGLCYCRHLHQSRGRLGAWVSRGNRPWKVTLGSVSMYPLVTGMGCDTRLQGCVGRYEFFAAMQSSILAAL